MTNKTISINPNLFISGLSKTKKNRDKKQPPKNIPIISPNVLKNKLLKRIKEHKQRETENLENNKKKLLNNQENKESNYNKDESNSFPDEFNDSINYLQTLSKQKKVNDEKRNYENQKQKRKEELERKTIKNYQSLNNSTSQPYVNIELPEELKITNTEPNVNSSDIPITISPYNYDNVPYGILKGGIKPTYRDWSRTRRNNIVSNPNSALIIQNSEINREKNIREKRLNSLREKLKLKQLEESYQKNEDIMLTQHLIQPPILSHKNQIIPTMPKTNVNTINEINITDPINEFCNNQQKTIAIKKIFKKTIKRSYTLEKSKIKNLVSVLIKDRGTRKKILNAQKDLKRKNINDIKIYLRQHNLIKIGSNAPNDVLRKLYESSMLAGEITNQNAETLLHNFSKDDKEI